MKRREALQLLKRRVNGRRGKRERKKRRGASVSILARVDPTPRMTASCQHLLGDEGNV